MNIARGLRCLLIMLVLMLAVCLILKMFYLFVFINEYRKRTQMSIDNARAYARRLSNTQNVLSVRFYKEMY
nr:MAG TPA: Protocadherin-15, LHFPL5, protocadherin, tip link [Microviridae sp.]